MVTNGERHVRAGDVTGCSDKGKFRKPTFPAHGARSRERPEQYTVERNTARVIDKESLTKKMQDWGFLFRVLDKVQSNSTVIGKIWIRALFIFRILILGTAAAIVWEDERSSLVCNTQQPGCENVCYDWKFPISHIRFWIVQVIFVSMPTILYLCHVIHVIHQKDKLRERVRQQHDSQVTNIPNYPDDEGHFAISLFISYLTHLYFKIILELAFIIAQYFLYGVFMSGLFTCASYPCPHSVECYMSRPTEKNIFNVLMLAMTFLSLLLSLIEAFNLLCSRARCSISKRR